MAESIRIIDPLKVGPFEPYCTADAGTKSYNLKCKILHETPNAILLQFPRGREEWFPLSTVNQIHRTISTAGYDLVNVDSWIVTKKDLPRG